MPDARQINLMELGLFTGQPQYENFARFKDVLPARKMSAAARPVAFARAGFVPLPETYRVGGEVKSTQALIEETDTAALLVLKEGQLVQELYRLSGGADVQWISWSVAKSFVSALVGIALNEGHIRSLSDPISAYVRVDPGSAYDGVSIRHVLQMSSGARWNEDYADPTSDVHRLGATMAGVMSLD